jgi:hypothetical protein
MSLMRSNAVVEQLAGSYSEEAVLDQLEWLYEEQIRHVSEGDIGVSAWVPAEGE